MKLMLIPKSEFERVVKEVQGIDERLGILADMNRANTLMAVKRAGSGHLGSSFSAMDIVVHLYCNELNTLRMGFDNPDRDIYFSSKGHDVPGLYAILFSLGVLPVEKLLALRRLGGLDGHPDVGIPGIEANSGSLGMGISKGRGMAWAKARLKREGRVFVLTGDGEWQEGQNFEALQGAAALKIGNLVVIVDHNKVQSDKPVDQIVPLGDLEAKFRTFGWYVARCNGHNHEQLSHVFARFRMITDRPKILIADTVKGAGVTFMEHPQALKDGRGYYLWHSGAPGNAPYIRAYNEILERIKQRFEDLGLGSVEVREVMPDGTIAPGVVLKSESDSRGDTKASFKSQAEFVADAYGTALVELAARRKDIVVLDADLAADCKVRQFEIKFPDRFIECGISEQDMVSMAGGLAKMGFLPVVNSFASFLAARANEQIYNNASEKTKIVYACHYAGLIPAGPGKSHQSIRDISLLAALPNMIILQPCCAEETRLAVEYAVIQSEENCALRLIIGPSPRKIVLPEDYRFAPGKGCVLRDGKDAVLMSYGPVMLHEALLAADLLAARAIQIRVINMPWLNRFDHSWLMNTLLEGKPIFIMEDHAPVGGLSDRILESISEKDGSIGRRIIRIGVEGFPMFGTPPEALKYHGLDGNSIANRLLGFV